jgi:L-aspartate oxidase
VGSGLAGLSAAFAAARHGTVALLCKSTLDQSSSYWAQGGIAAAIDPEDSAYFHFDDTIACGRGLCRQAAVEILVGEGLDRVRELIALGMQFDAGAEGLHLGLEGGHSRRRVLHANGNATGQAAVQFLTGRVLAEPQITLFEHTTVAELVVVDNHCHGAMAFEGDALTPCLFRARATILATGGAAGNYARTTNPPTSTGDGIALAYRAGAEVCDMEFMQFHPTALYHGERCDLPDQRGPARRGRPAVRRARAAVHAGGGPAGRAGPARRGGLRHLPRAAQERGRVRLPLHEAPGRRLRAPPLRQRGRRLRRAQRGHHAAT